MQEDLLHFIWQYQYYNLLEIITEDGEQIQVIKPGIHNHDAGPDFEQAKIIIDNVEWNGDVEIHIKSSDWKLHNHQNDKSYNKVVLHVVWENNKEVAREDGTKMPTLILKPLVNKKLIKKANVLIHNIEPISCGSQLASVPNIIVHDVIQRSLVKRLERKSQLVLAELDATKGDWDEVCYRIFMRQMGMKVNGYAFYELAKLLPYSLIKKYRNSTFRIEALLLGASGLLNAAKEDDYVYELKKEYNYLAHKHKLGAEMTPESWKFMRLRPANFPTLRLAQTAVFLSKAPTLLALFLEDATSLKKKDFFTANYWRNHYQFGKESSKKVAQFGKQSINLLLINVVAPIIMAYGIAIDDQSLMGLALRVIEPIKAEQNRIIQVWKQMGVSPLSSAESQGLIELYNESCIKKKCLTCGIGFSILKRR